MVSQICRRCHGVLVPEHIEVDLREPDLEKAGIQRVLDLLRVCEVKAESSYDLLICPTCQTTILVSPN
jgi:hypothetical protein